MIRGLLFKFIFYLGTVIVCLIFLPALILPKKIDIIGGKILGYWIRFCLYFFLSVEIKIKGAENIPVNSPFFIAYGDSFYMERDETFSGTLLFEIPIDRKANNLLFDRYQK